jgi:hypothetical protein
MYGKFNINGIVVPIMIYTHTHKYSEIVHARTHSQSNMFPLCHEVR